MSKKILQLIWQILLLAGGITAIGLSIYGMLHFIIKCI